MNPREVDTSHLERVAEQTAKIDPTNPEEILKRFHNQTALEQAAKNNRLEEMRRNAENVSREPQIVPVGKGFLPEDSNFHRKNPKDLVDYKEDVISTDNPTPKPIVVETEQNLSNLTTKERILRAEQGLGQFDGITSKSNSPYARSFIDEFGDETFYVENISNGHVVISDLDMEKIPRGKVLDLLKFADLETIKKSRDLRVALSGYGTEKLLKRLTPEEYMLKMEAELRRHKQTQQMRLQAEVNSQYASEPEPDVRPIIESKLEKLRLFYTKESHKGITPIEFIEWLATEKLTLAELDYISGSVQQKDIKLYILEKKQQLANE